MQCFRNRKFMATAMIFSILNCLPAPANAPVQLIKDISANSSTQIAVEFESGGSTTVPKIPHLLDLPGPNHRVIFDFSDASFEEGVIPEPESISSRVKKTAPDITAVHYTNLLNGDKPVARLVLDIDAAAKVNPAVAESAPGRIVLSLAGSTNAPKAQEVSKANQETQEVSKASQAATDIPKGAQEKSAIDKAKKTTETSPVAPKPIKAAEEKSETTSPVASNPSKPVEGKRESASPVAKAGSKESPDMSGFAGAASQSMSTESLASAAKPNASSNDALAPAADAKANQPQASQTQAASNSPSDPGARILEALKHYNNAVKFHLAGKLTEAVAEYQSAVALNPQLSEAHSNMGLVFNQQHNYAQALAEFRKALSINPRDAITYNGIGAALRAEKDLPAAIKNWQTAVELDPHLATACYNLGTAYEIQREYDRAIKAYRQAVKNDYRLGEAYYRIGLIMERQHRTQEAMQDFNQALKVSGNAEYSEDARQRVAYLQQNKKISKR